MGTYLDVQASFGSLLSSCHPGHAVYLLSSLSVPNISRVSSSAKRRVPAGLGLVTSVVDGKHESVL